MAVITGTRMFNTSIDIQADARRELVDMLNQQLADVITLHSQTKQAHWNVKGERFFQLHELYDELADDIFGYIDDTAERITALGGTALGTTELAANATTLPAYPLENISGAETLKLMVERYSMTVASVRQGIARASELDDPTTEDLLTEMSRVLDEKLYFLESHLQG